MSRHRLPREQAAIERHLERKASTSDDVAATESSKSAWNDSTKCDSEGVKPTDLDDWVRAAVTPEERARRAREVAERRHKEKAAEKAAQVKCFTGARTQSMLRQGRGGQPGSSSNSREASKQMAQKM